MVQEEKGIFPYLPFWDNQVLKFNISKRKYPLLPLNPSNVSREEIRWFNRIEVIFQTLHQQLYTKEPEIMTQLLASLNLSVGILDKSNVKEKHCKFLETLLKNADMENLLHIYITAI